MNRETDTDDAACPGRPRYGWLKPMRRLLVIIVITYVGVCGVVAIFQTRLIYFPVRGYRITPGDVGLPYEDLTLEAGDGVKIAAWFLPRENAKATILFCHGNAGNISDRLASLSLLHRLGYNVLIFDYRGFGRSAGRPSEEGTYLDAEAAWTYLTEDRAEPPQHIVVFGRSLGGAVATELARRHRPAALVIESTFTKLADIGSIHYPLLPVRLLLRHRYDSIRKVPTITCPKLFLHGSDDWLIPLTNARRLYQAAASPKYFIETPGGHNDAGFTYSYEYAERMRVFIDGATQR